MLATFTMNPVSSSMYVLKCKCRFNIFVCNKDYTMCRPCYNEEMAPPERSWWLQLRGQGLPESQHHCFGNWRWATGEHVHSHFLKHNTQFFSFRKKQLKYFSNSFLQTEKRDISEGQDDIESNLLVPAGVTMRSATLQIKVYRAEDVPQSELLLHNCS